MRKSLFFICSFFLAYSCSPIKTSSQERPHQMELTLHEVQTNLDDSRHDLNCFKTDMQILEGKLKHQDETIATLKNVGIEKNQVKIDSLTKQLKSLEQKIATCETSQGAIKTDMHKFSKHSNETYTAFRQYKERLNTLEKELSTQNRRFDEVAKLKTTLQELAQSMKTISCSSYDIVYKVKSGDSLEKIAKVHKTTIESLKKHNQLEQDLIVIGQELKIPISSVK